jgi:phosphate-selective porin OprO and OprP
MIQFDLKKVQLDRDKVQLRRGCGPVLIGLLFLLCGTGWGAEDIDIKVRLQPRLDFGHLSPKAGGSTYDSGQDAYLRRMRLEIVGRPRKDLRYIVAFSADRWDQQGRSPEVILGYALLNYRRSAALNLQFGLAKMPYSRGLLASSSRLLLSERAAVANLAGRFFKYFSPHLVLHGKTANNTLNYYLTLSDGMQAGDSDRAFSGKAVTASGDPITGLRLEFSPPGWGEGRSSDSHLGQGRHLTLGFNGFRQTGLELADLGAEERLLLGTDLSFHQQGFSLGAEYLYMERDGGDKRKTEGWYVQAGYFIKSVNLEPALRWGLVDPDTDASNDQTRVLNAGLNWYIEGHALKIQAGLSRHRFDRNARQVLNKSSKTVFHLQNQIYF